MAMFWSGLSRRCLATLAVVALLGLGTVGLHHFYVDAMGGHETAHDCLTCRIVGASAAVVASTTAGLTADRVFRTLSFQSLGIEHAGFIVRRGSRAPPAGLELLSVAF